MNRLTFQPVEVDGFATQGIMPCIDGHPLAALVTAFEAARNFDVQGGYGGILPRGSVGSVQTSLEQAVNADPLFGRTKNGSAILLECTCGVEGCWPLIGCVRLSDAAVIWDDFRQPHRPDRDYIGFGPFTFDIQLYHQAIQSVVAPDSGSRWTSP